MIPEPTSYGTRVDEHGESWVHWAMWNERLDDEDCEYLGDTHHYRGPGQAFSHNSQVKRTKRRTLQLTPGGYDI